MLTAVTKMLALEGTWALEENQHQFYTHAYVNAHAHFCSHVE